MEIVSEEIEEVRFLPIDRTCRLDRGRGLLLDTLGWSPQVLSGHYDDEDDENWDDETRVTRISHYRTKLLDQQVN